MLKILFKIISIFIVLFGFLVAIALKSLDGFLISIYFVFLGWSFWPSIVNIIKKRVGDKWWIPLLFRVVFTVMFFVLLTIYLASTSHNNKKIEQDLLEVEALEIEPEPQKPVVPLTPEEREARNKREKEIYEEIVRERGIKAEEWAKSRESLKSKDYDCSNKPLAYRMSQSFIEKSLKSPRSAKFPSIFSDSVFVENPQSCVFIIRSYVDSQNSFGAMIRTNYSIRLNYNPSRKTWSASDLIF